uniref:Uncharacterized protein n=1 Tax=Hucho hucho TaxID=62062 RepID=A0A4W5NYB9_9TELE
MAVLGPHHSSKPFLPDPSLVLARSLFTWDSAMSARSSASSNSCCSLRNLFLQLCLEQIVPALQESNVLLQVFIPVALHLLLDSQGLVAAPGLRLEGVSLDLFHFLIFLGQLALNIRLHLVELQLCPKDLALFVLQGTFCLLQC